MTEQTEHRELQPTFPGEFSRKLIVNTFFNLVGRFWSFGGAILLAPFIWSHLTPGEFGVWVLLSIFLESFTLLDFGLGSAFVKFISAYFTHGDYDRINRVLFSGLVFYVMQGTLVIGLGLAAQGTLFDFFDISTGAETAYLYVLVASALANIGSMFLSVFRGAQRMDRSNAIEMGMSILNVVGAVAALQLGWGLSGLALNALFNSAVLVVVAWWSVKRAMPWMKLGFVVDRSLLREMFSYGGQILVSRIGGLVCFRLDKLIVARFLGLAVVPFYEFSARLSALVRALPLLTMSALIPATSELGARNDKEKILYTYMMTSKYVALMTVGLVAFVVLEANSILRLWLGAGVEQSVILVQILVIGYGANVLVGAASQTGAGVGRPEFDMRSTILLMVLTPPFGILLVKDFGAPGVAAGTTLALVIAAIYLLVAFHRNYLGTSVSSIVREFHVKPIAAGLLAFLAVSLFHQAFPRVSALNEIRYLIPVKLFLDFAVFSAVYMMFLVAVRQVTAIDRRNFWGLMNFGFEFMRHPFREWVKIYR
ncbi:MAG TPA: oligosaccharide flippase family protein [Terriglobia bacterium]|nr:oligosaccharide flippase family protein [Terriglobia bacterium]